MAIKNNDEFVTLTRKKKANIKHSALYRIITQLVESKKSQELFPNIVFKNSGDAPKKAHYLTITDNIQNVLGDNYKFVSSHLSIDKQYIRKRNGEIRAIAHWKEVYINQITQREHKIYAFFSHDLQGSYVLPIIDSVASSRKQYMRFKLNHVHTAKLQENIIEVKKVLSKIEAERVNKYEELNKKKKEIEFKLGILYEEINFSPEKKVAYIELGKEYIAAVHHLNEYSDVELDMSHHFIEKEINRLQQLLHPKMNTTDFQLVEENGALLENSTVAKPNSLSSVSLR